MYRLVAGTYISLRRENNSALRFSRQNFIQKKNIHVNTNFKKVSFFVVECQLSCISARETFIKCIKNTFVFLKPSAKFVENAERKWHSFPAFEKNFNQPLGDFALFVKISCRCAAIKILLKKLLGNRPRVAMLCITYTVIGHFWQNFQKTNFLVPTHVPIGLQQILKIERTFLNMFPLSSYVHALVYAKQFIFARNPKEISRGQPLICVGFQGQNCCRSHPSLGIVGRRFWMQLSCLKNVLLSLYF